MSKNLASALSFLLASDAAEQAANAVPATVTAKVTATVSKPRAKRETVETVNVPSTNSAPPPVVMALPEKGSLDAKGFILATRKAKSRDEVIQAIHAFAYEVRGGVKILTGYDSKRDFGSQEMSAKLLAQREMSGKPIVSAPYQRSVIPSTAGYVAGMPDHNRRALNDLLGRERLAAETRDALVGKARDHSLPMAERKLSIGLARVEQCRLEEIRKDIEQFTPDMFPAPPPNKPMTAEERENHEYWKAFLAKRPGRTRGRGLSETWFGEPVVNLRGDYRK